MKTDLVATGFLINNGKILLIHHKKLDKWLPPGGHIDPNETPDETLKREMKEELGIEVEIISGKSISEFKVGKVLPVPFLVNVHSVGDHDHCSFDYVCKMKSGKVKINKSELNDHAWFAPKDLEDDRVLPGVREKALKAIEFFDSIS